MEKQTAEQSKSENVIVFWNENNILSVGSLVLGEPPTARILPGINKVSRRTWEYLTRHPIMKMNIEEGSLKLVTENGDSEWDDFETPQAVKFIQGMSDIIELERIERVSKKAQIKLAAQDRIQEIMKLIKPKDVK